MSRYLLLQRHTGEPRADGAVLWAELGMVEATTPYGAVRAHMASNKSEMGSATFLAVPERSARAMQTRVEQVRQVKVEVADQKGRPA